MVLFVLVAVFMLAMAIPAFAATAPDTTNSPTTGVDTGNFDEVGSDSDKVLEINGYYITASDKAAAEALAGNPASGLAQAGADSAYVLKGQADVHFKVTKDDAVTYEGSAEAVTVSFKMAGVTASDSVIVLHYKNGAWHKESASVSDDGTITVTFADGLSPIAVYTLPTDGNDDGGNNGNDDGGEVNPPTGETNISMVFIAVMAVAALGMALTKRA